MDLNAFTAGVEPGGLNKTHEIKILVCYLLTNIGQHMTLPQINEALLKRGLVNYFELADAMSDLLESGHLTIRDVINDNDLYEVTPLGIQTAKEFGNSLPLSIREKALRSATALLARQKNERENVVTIDKVQDGYVVNMIISDIGSDLMNLSLFMPTEVEAEVIKRRFNTDPLLVYKGILALMTGDMKTVGELIPSDYVYED